VIARLPSVVVLVWITVAVAPLLGLLVAFSAGLVFTVVMTVAIVVKSAHESEQQAEQDRRRAMREAALRAEVAERRRVSPDWGWPR
jgi:signal transduction histidine kinase